MPRTDTLTVHIMNDSGLKFDSAIVNNLNLTVDLPAVLLQLTYQLSKRPTPHGGGTTIWKMGKLAVAPPDNAVIQFVDNLDHSKILGHGGNNVVNYGNIGVWEVVMPNV